MRYIDGKIASAQDTANITLINKLNQQKEALLSDELGQREYAKMILQIGSGNVDNTEQISFHQADPANFSTTYKYKPSKVFVLQDKAEDEPLMEYNTRSTEAKLKALHYFYPQGFQSHKMQTNEKKGEERSQKKVEVRCGAEQQLIWTRRRREDKTNEDEAKRRYMIETSNNNGLLTFAAGP